VLTDMLARGREAFRVPPRCRWAGRGGLAERRQSRRYRARRLGHSASKGAGSGTEEPTGWRFTARAEVPDLEVVAPGQLRRLDPHADRRPEAEPSVVSGVAEQADGRFVDCLRRAERSVHERLVDADALVFR